jgi:hypothetical protein
MSSGLFARRGSGSPRDSKEWSTAMTAIDPERRGSGMIPVGTGPEADRLLPPQSEFGDLGSGTPSHDHRDADSFWSRTTGGPTNSNDRFSFPPSSSSRPPSYPAHRPSSTFSQFIHSKMFRNLGILGTALLLLISVLHSTKPEVLNTGMKYLSTLPGLSSLGKAEMRSLDERLRELMGRPVLEQWEMELTNRYQVR